MRKILKYDISSFFKGWFIGNFEPSIFKNENFEIAFKEFKKGDLEPEHYQLTAHEVTFIVSGNCRIGNTIVSAGEIIKIPPLKSADFEALSDCTLVAIKWPSLTEDKILGYCNEE